MYGKRSHGAYRKIAEKAKAVKIEESPFAEFLKCGSTILALTPHPVSWGPTVEDWKDLGRKMRRLS